VKAKTDLSDAKLWAQMIAFAPVMFQAARCLREFGVFKQLLAEPRGLTFGELQEKVDLSTYSLSVLLDAGKSSALIECGDGKFRATAAADYLETDALTRANMNFTHDVCYKGMFELEASLRHGRPEGLKEFGPWPTIYEGLTQLPVQALRSWLEFDHFYSDDAFPRVLPILFRDGAKTVLDVGGNTGKFAVACAKFNPEVNVTILDYPQQLDLAKQAADDAGVGERVHTQPAKLLDHSVAFPKNFDLLWMSQFLDCFGEDDILALLQRARAAMNENSRLFIMEPFIDRQRYEAAEFCLNMTSLYFTALANGKSRMYRAEDFHRLLKQAGLKVEMEFRVRLSHTLLKCKAI